MDGEVTTIRELPSRVRRFLLLGSYRCGSTLLAKTLGSHPQVRMWEELFNVGNLSRNPEQLLENPTTLVRKLFESGDSQILAVGLKLMYRQATPEDLDPSSWSPGPSAKIAMQIEKVTRYIEEDRARYLAGLEDLQLHLENDRSIRVLHLVRRNRLAAYVSFLRTLRDDLWVREPYQTRTLKVDPERCRAWFEDVERFEEDTRHRFRAHPVLEVSYRELVEHFHGTVSRILEFLEVEHRELLPGTSRQASAPLREVVQNYDEVLRYFKGTRWKGAVCLD